MSIVKAKEIRGMTDDQVAKQLKDLQNELLKERGDHLHWRRTGEPGPHS